MTGREIIKLIMEEQGVTNAELAARLNITQAALWDRLNNKKVKSYRILINLYIISKLG